MNTRDLIIDWVDKHKCSDFVDNGEDYEHFVNVLVDVSDFCIQKYKERIKEHMKNFSFYNKEWYNYYDEMIKSICNDDRS